MDLNKKSNETDLQYHKRLILGKLVDKTLADVDYSELSEFVYGQQYSSDVARRMMYGSRKTLELIEDESMKQLCDSAILSDLDSKMIELREERQRMSDQRRELNKIISANGRDEHLRDAIIAAASKISDEYETVTYDGIVNFSGYKNDAVLVFADWHYGMLAENICNKYNTEICRARVRDITKKAVDRIAYNQCENVHIVILGDIINGGIHTSSRVASEELVCDQMMHAAELLAESILYINQFVNNTFVYMTYGNHARTIQNKNDNIHRDNMERVIRWWLEERFSKYDDITIQEESDNEFLYFNVCGHDIVASHGDLDSTKTSPRLLHTLFSKKYNADIEYAILGDKHHYERFDELGITAVMCGSLCGTDDYANGKRLFSDPSQLLLIVNEDEGIDAEYKLKCTI